MDIELVSQPAHIPARPPVALPAKQRPAARDVPGPRRWCAQIISLALISWLVIAQGAEQVFIDAHSRGTAVAINARATIRAPHSLIWQTLTDYEHLAQFIPGIKRSHVIDRRGSAAIVEQVGAAGFLFFTYPIEVVVESLERPPAAIGIRVLKGNLKQLDGAYELEKVANQNDEFVLRWSGIIEPDISLPLFITVPLMRANISDQFVGMVREIERREALRARHSPD